MEPEYLVSIVIISTYLYIIGNRVFPLTIHIHPNYHISPNFKIVCASSALLGYLRVACTTRKRHTDGLIVASPTSDDTLTVSFSLYPQCRTSLSNVSTGTLKRDWLPEMVRWLQGWWILDELFRPGIRVQCGDSQLKYRLNVRPHQALARQYYCDFLLKRRNSFY